MSTTDDNDLHEVVFDGIRFLESLTRYYGAERGMAIWEQMGEVLGPDVKGQIFFGMLTGESSNRMRIDRNMCTRAVEAIKAIRTYTGMGLKEAKDAYDLSSIKTVTVECLSREGKRELTRELNTLGMLIT